MIKPHQHILVCITAKSCRYNTNGFVEELTRLPENRWGHACGALPTGVRPVQTSILYLCTFQAYIVVGGQYSSSVLTLLPGATAWTELASLPKPFYYAQASIVGGRLRVTWSEDDRENYRSEVMNDK